MTCILSSYIQLYHINWFLSEIMRWIQGTSHYCLSIEGGQLQHDKKVQAFLGDCCQFQRLRLTSDQKLSMGNNLCVRGISTSVSGSELFFTTDSKYWYFHQSCP